MDMLNGTYVLAVFGSKLWFVPSRPLTEQEIREFGRKGLVGTPPLNLFRAFLMRPGGMLIMRRLVITSEDSLKMGYRTDH